MGVYTIDVVGAPINFEVGAPGPEPRPRSFFVDRLLDGLVEPIFLKSWLRMWPDWT